MTLEAINEKVAKQWIKAAAKLEKGGAKAAKEPKAPKAKKKADGAAAASGGGSAPKLAIGGLKHKPATFKKGQSVTSTVTVTNNGSADASIKLRLYVNEAMADASTVTAKAGKSTDASFKWTAEEKNKLNIRGELVK